mgnify:CR=1 FL=1
MQSVLRIAVLAAAHAAVPAFAHHPATDIVDEDI